MELGGDTKAVLMAAGLIFWHGIRRDTDNQFREGEGPTGLHQFMWALTLVEIAGFSVLLAGFISEQIL